MRFLKLNTRGDTIIEVLIVVAVMSFILSVSMNTANRSMQGARQSQERAEALKLAESQLEILKNRGYSFAGSSTLFCLTTNPVTLVSAGWTVPPATASTDNLGGYPPECKRGTDNRYNICISRSSSTSHIFEARVRWSKLGSGGIDEVLLVYGVY